MGDALLVEVVDVVEVDVEVVAGAWVVLDGRVAGVDWVAMLPGSDASRGASTELVDLPSSAQLTPSTNAATTIAAMRVRAEQAR
jgi:hypothetical protein